MATAKSDPHGGRPLTLDELLDVADVAATGAAPSEVVSALARPRLHIAGGPVPERARAQAADEGGGYVIELGEDAALGRPGLSGERLDPKIQAKSSAHRTDGHRPPWVAQAVQPRHAPASASRAPLRRANGKELRPYYGVYGNDDRAVYYPSVYPWRCVGRIFSWTNWAGGGGWTWWGSGVLVGPRHVLTAGHVCPWGSASWAMRFVPSYWNGAPLLGAGSQSWTSDFRGWNPGVAAHDMAVLRLYDPIGSWLGWMGTKVYDSSWNNGNYWTLAGYPAAVASGERPSYQSGIPVLDDDNDGDGKELEHHGDVTGGDSGGPFFGFWNDGPYAVGTTSGGERIWGTPFGWGDEDNNIEAAGKAMVDLVSWARTNWA